MENVQVATADLSDEEVLSYTQRKRLELVEHLTAGKMPSDTAEQSILISALNDLDKQVVNRKKLKIQEGVADNINSAVDTMDSLFKLFGNKSPLEVEVHGETIRKPAIPDGPLIDISLVPGELDVGNKRIEFEDIGGSPSI